MFRNFWEWTVFGGSKVGLIRKVQHTGLAQIVLQGWSCGHSAGPGTRKCKFNGSTWHNCSSLKHGVDWTVQQVFPRLPPQDLTTKWANANWCADKTLKEEIYIDKRKNVCSEATNCTHICAVAFPQELSPWPESVTPPLFCLAGAFRRAGKKLPHVAILPISGNWHAMARLILRKQVS